MLAEAGARREAAVLLGGLRAHGRAESWGEDEAEMVTTDARLRSHLGDAYGELLDQGGGLSPADLVGFAEHASGGRVPEV